jgi:RimJ/RimL family protein N-acetyltransferase
MRSLFPVTLSGRLVRLEPLAHVHVDGLVAAASESRDTYGLTFVPVDEPSMTEYVDAALAGATRGDMVPFATIDARTGRVLGSTRFCNIERWAWTSPAPEPVSPVGIDAVEIGWTWLAASAQRTGINTDAKLLMLAHAFDAWRVRCVRLKTDARNTRSRANIERVGARLDGIIRAHMPAADGITRDSALYSLLAVEWPAARDRLAARLAG